MAHPTMHLLLLSLHIATAAGKGLEKGPLENKVLDVPEGTPVPYALYQVTQTHTHTCPLNFLSLY
uniref:Uncharacterized protein n=1 Tax=Hucho hucho TaxID=62062 RepID=A0A4W5L6L8_9TELE